MRIDSNLTDDAVLAELGQRLGRHRLDRNLSQDRFAQEAGIGRRTVQRLERGETVQMTSFVRALRTLGLLEGLGTVVPAPLPSPMEQLEHDGARRRRARASRSPDTEDEVPWTWGDEPQGDR